MADPWPGKSEIRMRMTVRRCDPRNIESAAASFDDQMQVEPKVADPISCKDGKIGR